MVSQVIGREEELGAIRAFLDAVEHGPAALVLSGGFPGFPWQVREV